MRYRGRISLAVLLMTVIVHPTPHAQPPPSVPELLVVVHPSVPAEVLDRSALSAIFSMTRRSWGGGLSAVPFNYPPETEMRRNFDKVVLDLEPNEVSRFWIDQRIRGYGHPPRQISDPAMLLRLVTHLKGSIGYLPAPMTDKSVRVVARIRQGKVFPP
jgi:hypothetical protein